jgi:hypothetical protein
MPRGQLTKDDIKIHVERLKKKINFDHNSTPSEKKAVNEYLNLVLDKIGEYSR